MAPRLHTVMSCANPTSHSGSTMSLWWDVPVQEVKDNRSVFILQVNKGVFLKIVKESTTILKLHSILSLFFLCVCFFGFGLVWFLRFPVILHFNELIRFY